MCLSDGKVLGSKGASEGVSRSDDGFWRSEWHGQALRLNLESDLSYGSYGRRIIVD